jgi:hypothetical protein
MITPASRGAPNGAPLAASPPLVTTLPLPLPPHVYHYTCLPAAIIPRFYLSSPCSTSRSVVLSLLFCSLISCYTSAWYHHRTPLCDLHRPCYGDHLLCRYLFPATVCCSVRSASFSLLPSLPVFPCSLPDLHSPGGDFGLCPRSRSVFLLFYRCCCYATFILMVFSPALRFTRSASCSALLPPLYHPMFCLLPLLSLSLTTLLFSFSSPHVLDRPLLCPLLTMPLSAHSLPLVPQVICR